jgi:hypothetical protein
MAEEEKKPGEDSDQPPSETVLEKQRDPDEAVFAEQAIHEYATWILDQFRESALGAIDALTGWMSSQADPSVFDNNALFAQLNTTFMKESMKAFGGSSSPIGQALLPILSGPVDAAERQEKQASYFITEMQRAMRDATWYLRDNLQGILANQWDQLRDLAYEGSTEFIPVLHHLGLPQLNFDAAAFTHKLTATADAYRQTVPQQKEQVEDQAQTQEPKAEEEQSAKDSQQQFQDQEQTQKAS